MAESGKGVPAYRNPSEPVEKRVADLLSRMTLEQKVSQMYNSAGEGERACRLYRSKQGEIPVCLCWTTAIDELDVPSHDWWNEALHGCASSWVATVFPQAIGMAAAWNPELLHRVATTISDEARAKHHESMRAGATEPHTGLTYWSPNINIFRDPRWGRGQETYGEDPYLTARLGMAFVRGLQGGDPRYLKTVATPKHFAAHSGPERMRHSFDSQVSERDMRETYLPAFGACVKEGGAASVMSAYDRTNGEACSASKALLIDILRREWGFEGFVVSDCGAVADICGGHRLVDTAAEASALAVKNGCDLNCGEAYRALVEAVEQGLIEVVQLYLTDVKSSSSVPIRSLQGFRRIHLAPGAKQAVEFEVKPEQMGLYKANGDCVIEPGEFAVAVGGGQPDSRGTEEKANVVRGRFEVVGAAVTVGR